MWALLGAVASIGIGLLVSRMMDRPAEPEIVAFTIDTPGVGVGSPITVSPDGRWLCYNSDESGRVEGYVQSFPTPGLRTQVTTDGTGVRGWKADGKQLALGPTPDQAVRAVDILPGEEFKFGPARVLGKRPEVMFGVDFDRAWSRSIAIVPAGNQPQPTIRIVLNWDAMIAKR